MVFRLSDKTNVRLLAKHVTQNPWQIGVAPSATVLAVAVSHTVTSAVTPERHLLCDTPSHACAW